MKTVNINLQKKSSPDVLEVIPNLTNSEIRTPVTQANAVLDLLPPNVWNDPSLRWFDPGVKTGVFLREIASRLNVGLANVISDPVHRRNHILEKMIFGVATTNIASQMARRSLYGSRNADGPKSIFKFDSPQGNIWYQNLQHDVKDDKCADCKESGVTNNRSGNDNHAYAFIHKKNFEVLEKVMEMKFDIIVGNPPYNLGGGGKERAVPLYQKFVEQAIELNPKYIAMIIQSRWMQGGLGLNEFRKTMLSDSRIRKLVDFPVAQEVFPGTQIKGGVCYFLWDRDSSGACEYSQIRGKKIAGPFKKDLSKRDILIRDPFGDQILDKVQAAGLPSIREILAADKEFGLTSNFKQVHSSKKEGSIAFYHNEGNKRLTSWILPSQLLKSHHLINAHKVLIPKASSDGGIRLPDIVLGPAIVVGPPSACTQTYLFLHLETKNEALSAHSYYKTKFFRYMVSLRKIGQDATPATYTWVPKIPFDRSWTDEELFEYFKLNQDERSHIEKVVKEIA